MLINYIPARLIEGKTWTVVFYVENPKSTKQNKLERQRIRVGRIKSVTERRKFGRKLVHEINVKLAEGWNPILEHEAPKAFHKLSDAIDTFMNVKRRELRKDSIRSYDSMAKRLLEFIKEDLPIIYFTRQNAVEYLNHIYVNNKVSEVVYNNNRNFGRLLFNWLIENQYCKDNPFNQIKSKKERAKTRIPITEEARTKIKSHLEQKGEHEFLAFCLFVFYTLMRPSEVFKLKPEMFLLSKNLIILPPEICKDDTQRVLTIPEFMFPSILKLRLDLIPANNYIFSTGFKPGKLLKDSRYSGKRWTRLRNEIDIPKEMQLYSLKDTGIIQMIDSGIDLKTIRDQAGHSSLEVTNKYTKFANQKADKQILDKTVEF